MGCCALALAAFLSPRLVLFLMWLFSDRLDFAFDSFFAGFAGFLVLPWTTLMYALAYAPIAGVEGIGWLFVGAGLAGRPQHVVRRRPPGPHLLRRELLTQRTRRPSRTRSTRRPRSASAAGRRRMSRL